ncbi:HTH CenpB-type DNA-binding domain and Homeodomain-like and Brinker DNA-binding domain-containing protein [Strongyloides ratti]|uniref:HTH CenpB-type DNA-binding domain and Homeodomain-like and Brinker DNA-binding domain-containing protein n=1 Tax=Strongyloides ratti TaxID=34506 RepID=A0A090LHW1_STRRB|nr:HTH CenpB-type DNA-binding domain and Homeodomain-like and Brinker DNA-binding domain-containing protein [Strongyloides ratti]CEF67708.1 HTH CenpB-type DNA-binding domain and Homeodomain-like and Brinker DNA-binding domain-containing protein [Strongyloides ratti]
MEFSNTSPHFTFIPQLTNVMESFPSSLLWSNNSISLELLAANIKLMQQSPSIIPKPTPIYQNTLNFLQTPQDVPLDLSTTNSSKQLSPIKITQKEDISFKQKTFLPTCTNPGDDSNFIKNKLEKGISNEKSTFQSNSVTNSTISSSGTTVNRMSYPREFKLMVIDYFHNNGQNKYRTCKQFQITKSMLNGWIQKLKQIESSRPGSLKSGRSGRKPQFPNIEKQLFNLYNIQMDAGKKVSNKWIRETARKLAQEQCSEKELAGMCQFSERWLSNFKKRYSINLNKDYNLSNESNSTNTNEDGTSDTESIESEESESKSLPIKLNKTELLNEIINNKTGQLPIQAFYEKYPWLCKKSSSANRTPSI